MAILMSIPVLHLILILPLSIPILILNTQTQVLPRRTSNLDFTLRNKYDHNKYNDEEEGQMLLGVCLTLPPTTAMMMI